MLILGANNIAPFLMENFYDRYKQYLNLLMVAVRLRDSYLAKRANDELKKMESATSINHKPVGNYYSPISKFKP